MEVPEILPSYKVVVLMFEDFQVNYRKLESWHARRRSETLQLHLEAHTDNLFAIVKPQPKGALEHIEEETSAYIIGVSEDHKMIHLDQEVLVGISVTYKVEGAPVQIHKVQMEGSFQPGDELWQHNTMQRYQRFNENSGRKGGG